jgi:hypothetical protein
VRVHGFDGNVDIFNLKRGKALSTAMFFEKMLGVHWNIGVKRDYKTVL